MFHHKFVFACILFVCLGSAAFAQPVAGITVPLIVDKGFPLQVFLTEKLHFKENEPVRATIVEPVYAFDRVVIPSGTRLEGTITALRKPGRWQRITSMLGGNFTPLSEPQITFHTLVLASGARIPIETSVLPGTEKVVASDDQRQIDLKNFFVSTAKKPEKELLKNALWGLAPYRPQYAPVGTRLSVILEEPVDFGVAVFENGALDDIGSEPPFGSIAKVRLLTPLNSRVTKTGAPVEAQLIRPLFSKDGRLIFPVGARLQGSVTEVDPARARHHNGQLAFSITTISPPDSWGSGNSSPQEVGGSLVSLEVTHEMKDLRVKENNTTKIVESKKRFIAPAWAFIKAERSLSATSDPFEKALLGAYRGKFLKQFTGGSDSGFGLAASVSGAMIPPVGIGLSFYGAARSVYSNFLRRGRDINLPDNTAMDLRLEKRSQAPR